MGKLFGTDGIRGVANQYPMTPEMAVTIGRAVAAIFKGDDKQSKIIIGKDTRISGDMLEHALVSGICSWVWMHILQGFFRLPVWLL
jgi:phosphoglucosamine mutase